MLIIAINLSELFNKLLHFEDANFLNRIFDKNFYQAIKREIRDESTKGIENKNFYAVLLYTQKGFYIIYNSLSIHYCKDKQILDILQPIESISFPFYLK